MRRALGQALPFFMVLAIAIAGVVGVRTMSDREHQRNERALLLQRIQSEVNLVSALEWQGIASRQVSAELDEHRLALTGSIRGALMSMDDAALSDAMEEYLAAVEAEFVLIREGDVEEALEVDEARVDPAFEEVHELLVARISRFGQEADSLNDIGDIAVAAIVAGAVLLSGALLVVVQRARTRSEIMGAEQAALRASEARFRPLVQNAMDMITVMDDDGVITYQSPSSVRLLGRDPATMVGRPLREFIHQDDEVSLRSYLQDAIHAGAALELRMSHVDGGLRSIELRGTVLQGDSLDGQCVLNARDVSDRKQLEDQLRTLAFQDPLTGIANRARFLDRLQQAIRRCARRPSGLVVLFIDIDDFKAINDSLGHSAGDEVLLGLTDRLATCLRPEDTLARLGGDEFAVLLEDSSESTARMVCDRILAATAQPTTVNGQEIFVRTSIGCAVSRRGEEAPEDLLRNADLAMYLAKGNGKGRMEMYEPGMHARMQDRFLLQSDLQRAVEAGEFALVYQPTVALSSGEIVGVEALIRWNHPTRGCLMPSEFISIAEEVGLINRIGRWVLHEACGQMKIWGDSDPAFRSMTLAVNLSPKQLLPGIVEIVADALQVSGLDPRSLTLEITEGAMMHDHQSGVRLLRSLRDLGVRVALDDFGTGYSSLRYLNEFPIDIIKVDKSFVDSFERGDTALTDAIIGLGLRLQLEVVAEGVERAEDAATLRTLGCTVGQGFFFARPLPPKALESWLAERGSARDKAA